MNLVFKVCKQERSQDYLKERANVKLKYHDKKNEAKKEKNPMRSVGNNLGSEK